MPVPGPRYAIYFVPGRASDLYKFGASILGYDCYAACDVPFSEGIDATDWAPVVASPKQYGFHATLKAPFYLADGTDENELCRELQAFGGAQPAVRVDELLVRELHSFIALVPKAQSAALSRLEQETVERFDRFRAPLSEGDRQRRVASGLTARQLENLERWGYPYVGDDFRFHMTLTGPLPSSERQNSLSVLCHKFEMIVGPVTVDQIAVMRQIDNAVPFHVIRTASLGHSPYRPYAYSF